MIIQNSQFDRWKAATDLQLLTGAIVRTLVFEEFHELSSRYKMTCLHNDDFLDEPQYAIISPYNVNTYAAYFCMPFTF